VSAFVEVPWRSLSEDALRGVIEDFVTRDGTDYGERETTTEQKLNTVREQLRRGELVIVFESALSSIQLVPKHDWLSHKDGED